MNTELETIAESLIFMMRKKDGTLYYELYRRSYTENKNSLHLAFMYLLKNGYIERVERQAYDHMLTEKGWEFIPFEESRQNILKQKERENIKHWYDTENAKIQFEDYPKVKRKANWALWISGCVIILELLKMILQK